MNAMVIDLMLALFWTGFIALNVWLLRASVQEAPAPASKPINPTMDPENDHAYNGQ